MNVKRPSPHDDGVPGTIYILHFDPPYKHARHYVGWTDSLDAAPRVQQHLRGQGSPLVRAAVAAGCTITLAATRPGTRNLERLLKRRHGTGRFCDICKAARAAARAAAREAAA